MTPKGHKVIRSRLDPLYYSKGHGDFCGQFDQFMTPKGQRNIRGRDLLYDPKSHCVFCGQFDLGYDPKRSKGQ